MFTDIIENYFLIFFFLKEDINQELEILDFSSSSAINQL